MGFGEMGLDGLSLSDLAIFLELTLVLGGVLLFAYFQKRALRQSDAPHLEGRVPANDNQKAPQRRRLFSARRRPARRDDSSAGAGG